MYYNLSSDQENYLQKLPETGMGYQIIEAFKAGEVTKKRYLILNSQISIDSDSRQNEFVKKVLSEGLVASKKISQGITLTGIKVLTESEIKNKIEPLNKNEKGANDNPKEPADGKEMFTRLSAFEDDKRIDKINKCLLPGSFTTTQSDYLRCKINNENPIDRYALPSNDEIRFAFEILPKQGDILQRGIVQPANGKMGGGKEAYFENGTSNDTFINQHAY